MAYTDYEFYTETYGSDVISEDEFSKYAERASDRIDALTFDRLIDNYPDNERADKKIQKAACALAETLYYIELARSAAMDSIGTITNADGTVTSKLVTSRDSGSEGITYSSGSSSSSSEATVYEAAVTDLDAEQNLIRRTATQYLSGVRDSKGTLVLYGGL